MFILRSTEPQNRLIYSTSNNKRITRNKAHNIYILVVYIPKNAIFVVFYLFVFFLSTHGWRGQSAADTTDRAITIDFSAFYSRCVRCVCRTHIRHSAHRWDKRREIALNSRCAGRLAGWWDGEPHRRQRVPAPQRYTVLHIVQCIYLTTA